MLQYFLISLAGLANDPDVDLRSAALLALQTRVIDRLWLPPELAQAWCGAHAQTLAVLDQCLARLHQCRAGFAALPLEVQAGPAADTLPSPASETTETFRPAGLSSHA